MIPLALMIACPLAAIPVPDALSWLAKFGTRVVARRLDVPEIVVHAICLYVAAYIGEVERNASLVCPIRVFRELRRGRPAHRPNTAQRGTLHS